MLKTSNRIYCNYKNKNKNKANFGAELKGECCIGTWCYFLMSPLSANSYGELAVGYLVEMYEHLNYKKQKN